MKPKIAIIGRPNVGKSTLYNRLTGTRHALVDNQPGVTRDRRHGQGSIGPLEFTIIDTAGLEEAEKDSLASRMTAQTMEAVTQADIILLMVDATAGITPPDEHFVEIIRRSNTPVVLIANKVDVKKAAEGIHEAFGLGLGDPVAISAEHGTGMAELYDAVMLGLGHKGVGAEEEEAEYNDNETTPMQLAILGRPNVGKSTFINALLKEDRLLTGPEAGITRDSIAVDYSYDGKPLQLIDTAGMRKKANIQQKLEKLAVNDTRRALQFAHVCVLMVDATEALEKQDLQIASMIAEEGRACVLALNKWDQIDAEEGTALLREVGFRINEVMPQFKGMPFITCSAERGKGLARVLDAAFAMYSLWNKRIPTAGLNEWLADMVAQHTPPLKKGRRIKLKYISQIKTRPPTFALHVNQLGLAESYRRFLVNGLRERYDMPGVPIRLHLKKGKNPYDKEG